MGTKKVKSFSGASRNPMGLPALTAAAASACLFVIALGLGYGKSAGGLPLLRATTAEIVDEPTPNESEETKREHSGRWQTMKMRVTAYCPCEICCGEYSDGMTACGHRIQPGDAFVAADNRYAFGIEVSVPGYNRSQPVKVLDRGGAIRGDRLDVFFHTHEEALDWGVQFLSVKVRAGSSGT